MLLNERLEDIPVDQSRCLYHDVSMVRVLTKIQHLCEKANRQNTKYSLFINRMSPTTPLILLIKNSIANQFKWIDHTVTNGIV